MHGSPDRACGIYCLKRRLAHRPACGRLARGPGEERDGALKERKYPGLFPFPWARGLRGEGAAGRSAAAVFLAVMGPGFITAFADNDAGGIATYIEAGSRYGYSLLFVLGVSTVFLAIAQEISARTGAVTGKGLFELLRERYGALWCYGAAAVLLLANLGTTVSEFSGIAAGFELLGVGRLVAVPAAAAGIWLLVVKGDYGCVEKVFFLLCTTFAGYVVTGFLVEPPWGEVARATLVPDVRLESGWILMAMGIIGTTITPWGQFYIQSSVVDKGIGVGQYRFLLADVLIGTFFTGLVAFFVVIAAAAVLYGAGAPVETMRDAAAALAPFAGRYAAALFAVGLIGASLLAAVILPLSTAYAVCEALGLPHGISKSWREAPAFFRLYAGLLFLGAGASVLPGVSLYHLMLFTQVLNGILLPPILVCILRIAGDEAIMGRYKNPRLYHAIAWLFTLVIAAVTAVLLAVSIKGL